MQHTRKKKLILENGSVFCGDGFGSDSEAVSELVFHTSMAGYPEVVSDPSYTGQMVVMTYPLIGNYGMADEDFESNKLTVGGLIVREYSDSPSHFRYSKSLGQVMGEYGVPGISGIDTRRLTRILRDEGSQKAILTSQQCGSAEAAARLAAWIYPENVVAEVSSREIWYAKTEHAVYDVVAVDCGIKRSIVRKLNERGCNVTIVPYDTPPEMILNLAPDGVFLSNGPGNPEHVQPVIELVKKLRGKLPIFGICLGHQIISLACGARTYKLKFGHRGGNHPVKNLQTGKIEITSQNHSFAVDAASLAGTGLELTHLNLLDHTAEGVACKEDRLFSVQFHPESAPGPQDSAYLFDQFTAEMKKGKEHCNA